MKSLINILKALRNLAIGTAPMVGMCFMSGCLKNDIPYPRIQPNITAIEAVGLTKAAEIDSVNRLITLNFDESVDINRIHVTSYKLSPGASIVRGSLDSPINLSKYYIVTLRLYQDYDWVIQGKQTINRYFTVENQVGETIIDIPAKRVVVTVSGESSLKSVKVLSMKLGPDGCIQTPNLIDKTIDLSAPIDVTVEAFGREEKWTIFGEFVETTVTTVGADAWTQVAWVYGTAVAGRDNGVEYRQQGTDDWTKAPTSWVTNNEGSFYARLINLNPLTTYEARAYSEEEYGEVVTFTTGAIEQMPNSTLSEWHKDGKIWCPWPDGGTPYWGTGNKGATTLGESNTVPTDDTSSGTGQGAKLETRFVGIGIIGKLAAGNIFTGSYVRTDGTNGVLSFGRPFTERPTKLSGYLKYTMVPISHTSKEMADMKGKPDACVVWCALIDTDEPFELRTNPANRKLFDPEGPGVVAYGKFESDQSIPEYIPFEFNLNYVSTSRRPKYIIVVASSSKYGDYFTGGSGSTLYIDDLELHYDY